MTSRRTVVGVLLLVITLIAVATAPGPAVANDELDAKAALDSLYRSAPAAKELRKTAKGILVFPRIVKAGFMVGAQYGHGTLFKNGKAAGTYNLAAGSYGFQAGVQGFAYAMFFMTDDALAYLDKTGGFEVGAGPSVVVVDKGAAKSLTSTTARKDVYAFVFGQKGLMAGAGLQGSKITKISP